MGGAGHFFPFAAAAGGEDVLGELVGLRCDDGRVAGGGGAEPYVRVVPAHFGFVAEGDVVDVEQDLLFTLAVPDLVAGVSGVGQDGADGALGPGDAAAVPVAVAVVC